MLLGNSKAMKFEGRFRRQAKIGFRFSGIRLPRTHAAASRWSELTAGA
jgi:hypothetical protein